MATIIGTSGDDVLIGTTGNDTYQGFFGGNDVVWDFGGYDTYIFDGSFNDFIDSFEDPVTGTETLVFTGGQLVLNGAGFENNGSWGDMEEVILNDFLFKTGTAGDDLMNYSGQGHRVALESHYGNDTLMGSAFDDDLGAGEGSNVVFGNAGNDLISLELNGNNTVDGGAGYDTLAIQGGEFYGTGITVLDEASNTFLLGAMEGHFANGAALLTGMERVVSSGGIAQFGSAGADVISGADGMPEGLDIGDWFISPNDSLYGLGGNDSLTGGDGNDTLDGGTGNDTLNGGVGSDFYVVDSLNDVIEEVDDMGAYDDTVMTSVSWTLADNLENLNLAGGVAGLVGIGNAADNYIFGNELANTLDGAGGNDFMEGGAGNDVLVGGGGNDSMQGGSGNDVYVIDSTGDVIWESSGYDTVVSSVINIDMAALAGLGGSGNTGIEQAVLQGTGNLTITDTTSGDDRSSSRKLVGNSGANTITGNNGDDTIDGGVGADRMLGGTGHDTFYVDNSADLAIEAVSAGVDVVFSSVTFTLGVNVEHLVLTGGAATNGTGNASANTLLGNDAINSLSGKGANDTLEGAGGNDYLNGGDGNDYVSGGADKDAVYGGNGNDTLVGGAGADSLYGGLGNDLLIGGEGADRFVFDSAPNSSANRDRIQNFETGVDSVRMDDAIFTGLTAGTLAASAFALGTAAADASDRIIYDSATGSLYYDADGTGASAQVKFAILVDMAAITASSFTVY